jgi:hypothetical protein
MEGLVWVIGVVAIAVLAMILRPGKRRRRPRWTSSSDLDPVIFANTDNHHHHHGGHDFDAGAGHHH